MSVCTCGKCGYAHFICDTCGGIFDEDELERAESIEGDALHVCANCLEDALP